MTTEEKAKKFDELEDLVSQFYNEDQVEDDLDLGDLGEAVAIYFGYL